MAYENDFRLGFIVAKIGLKLSEIDALITGEMELSKDSNEIREFILTDVELNSTLLRRLIDLGLSLEEVSDIFYPNKDTKILEMNIDNPTYRVNTMELSSKLNSKVREILIDVLMDHGISTKVISKALDIGYTTVRGYVNKK